MEALAELWGWVKDNADAVMAIVAVLSLLGGALRWAARKEKAQASTPVSGRGGQGGSASVGGNGVAIGGRGGMGGTGGHGGQGGGSHVQGHGLAIGGDGGDAGVPWRPSLGAPSTIARFPSLGFGIPHERDEFGFYVVGRGGAGGDLSATVLVDGHSIPLLPLLELLRLWAPAIIERADSTRPSGPQEFWETVTRLDPTTAKAAVDHARHCIEVTIPAGLPAPDPYARQSKSDKKI